MRNKFNIIIVLVLFIAIALSAYFAGKKSERIKTERIINNQSFIKQIAELSSLEINGKTEIKESNITNDGSIDEVLKKFFTENTIEIGIPYTAKYGVKLDSASIQIQENENGVNIVLPVPQLINFELKLDQLNKNIKNGIFSTSDNDDFIKTQSKLYNRTKQMLMNDTTYKNKAKIGIRKIISAYYQPLNIKTNIIFKDEIKGGVSENLQ